MAEQLAGWLFAAADLARTQRSAATDLPLAKIGVVVAFFVVSVVVIWLVVRRSENTPAKRIIRSWRKLTKELCLAHDLDRADQRLLHTLAKRHHLKSPAMLFLRPELFAPEATTTWLRGQERRLEALRDRLFAGLEDDSAAEFHAEPAEESDPAILTTSPS